MPQQPNATPDFIPDTPDFIPDAPGPKLPVPTGLQGPSPTAHVKPAQAFMEQGGQDILDAAHGVKSALTSIWEPVTPEPPKPLLEQLGRAGKDVIGAVTTPFKDLGTSDVSIGGFHLPNADLATIDLLGGDSKKYKEFLDKGNFGAATWEAYGKPLFLMAAGSFLGGGRAVTEGATAEQSMMIKNVMAKGAREQAGNIALEGPEIKWAQEALQDAARDEYGTGPKGFKKLKKATPSLGNPFTVDKGNESLLKLSDKAAEIAGQPADQVNTALGYMDGREAAKNISRDLRKQADKIAATGDNEYANALRRRAEEIEGKTTLGDIFEIKKTANRLADMPKNVKESYDLLDSRAEQAQAIRNEIYPRYQEIVKSSMMPGFDMAQLGRKEGAAIKFRNGWYRMSGEARVATSERAMPGHIGRMAARGTSEGRMKISLAERALESTGIVPSEAGNVNAAGRRIIGKLSPETVPESIKVERGSKFGVKPPVKQLPGKTATFTIPTTPIVEEATGVMAQPAEARYAGKVPAPEKNIPPSETPEIIRQGVKTRMEAGEIGSTAATVPERLMPRSPLVEEVGTTQALHSEPVTGQLPRKGATKSNWQYTSAPTEEPSGTKIGGGGTMTTSDPAVARETLKKLNNIVNSARFGALSNQERMGLLDAIDSLTQQLAPYPGGNTPQITHTPPGVRWTPRKKGTLPKNHKLRRGLPAAVSDVERESEDEE
jgi:hypothetical protein